MSPEVYIVLLLLFIVSMWVSIVKDRQHIVEIDRLEAENARLRAALVRVEADYQIKGRA